MDINAHTELYCLLGKPARHSLSPAIQNAAFQSKGINAVYLAFEPESLEAAIHAMRTLPVRGASVTIPYKTEVMGFLDRIDPLAGQIGSANTLVFDGGIITGYNTDGYGALRALSEKVSDIHRRRILILGNGGSARAIAFTLLREGASVVLAGRNRTRVHELAADLSAHRAGVESLLISECTRELMKSIDIIVNTTPVGMSPDTEEFPLDPVLLAPEHSVMDIVYSPRHTRLLREALKTNCTVIEGLSMLLYQGARQFELWTGAEAPVETMRRALFELLPPDPPVR